MNLAIIGCGYVSEFYAKTLPNYPELRLVGACDVNPAHLEGFCRLWPTKAYASLEDLLADSSVELVLNLTNPRRHFEITKRCLEAGKHVYSEKPLAMTADQARELVDLAASKKLRLAAAPCSLLSETAQTLGKAIRDGLIGKVRLVYANFDDGMIAPHMQPWEWRNGFGAPWPARDEFEVGCTYEHAGYVLTWLGAFFGPVRRITSFASTQLPNKGLPVDCMAPDFTTGCLEYDGGIVARVTCGLVAPRDKSLTVIGDDGVLHVADVRQDAGPVRLRRQAAPSFAEKFIKRLGRTVKLPFSGEEWWFQSKLPLVRQPQGRFVSASKAVDFSRGPAELAAAIREQRPSRLSPEFAWHITEIVEALQHPERRTADKTLQSSFSAIAPAAWAA